MISHFIFYLNLDGLNLSCLVTGPDAVKIFIYMFCSASFYITHNGHNGYNIERMNILGALCIQVRSCS